MTKDTMSALREGRRRSDAAALARRGRRDRGGITDEFLSARVVNPVGGNTEYADMRAAYDALDAATRAEIEDLVCEHSLMYSRGSLGMLECSDEERAMFKPVRQRLVRTHPVTGRKSLYLASHAGAIVGMPMAKARILLRDLNEHATQPKFVHAHTWRVGDLVMWDNRQVTVAQASGSQLMN